MRAFRITEAQSGAAFTVRVTTRARRREIVGIHEDGSLRIRLTCPPDQGKANEELVEFLAEVLGVAKSRIEIVAGEHGREKLVSVDGLSPETVNARLQPKPSTDEG